MLKIRLSLFPDDSALVQILNLRESSPSKKKKSYHSSGSSSSTSGTTAGLSSFSDILFNCLNVSCINLWVVFEKELIVLPFGDRLAVFAT